MKPILLDTGLVVALLDKDDSWHGLVKRCLPTLTRSGPLLTTGAVVTEIMHFLADHPGGPERAAAFLEDTEVGIVDVFSPAQLRFVTGLMEKYHWIARKPSAPLHGR